MTDKQYSPGYCRRCDRGWDFCSCQEGPDLDPTPYQALGKHLAEKIAKQTAPRPDMIEAILGMQGGEQIALEGTYGVPEGFAATLTHYLFKR